MPDIHAMPEGAPYLIHLSDGRVAAFNPNALRSTVMLIFKGRFDGRPLNQVKLLGSGFFISPTGIFLTARHVVDEDIDEVATGNLSCAIIDAPSQTLKYFTITELGNSADFDIAVGRADLGGQAVTCSRLTDYAPMINEDVFTFGYSESRTELVSNALGRVFLNPQVYTGVITELALEERVSAYVPPPVYVHSVPLGSGISGGPLFSPMRNRAIAVNSTSFDLPDGERPLGISTPIGLILNMSLPFLGGRTLRDCREELGIDIQD
ncbi:MAG: serine protease [Proteobacteria bacterium]|nr:MAG: serine protease [Pseudomonadota bacterium]